MENPSTDHKTLRSAGKVSLGTMFSRILGLIREQVFAYLFGAGVSADAFVAAFRIPNLLRDMFAEGALSAAFIPTFTEKLAVDGKSEAFRVARIVLSFLMVAVTALVTAGIIFAPSVVNEIAGGFEDVPGKIELTTGLARVMMPFLLLVSLAALMMGILNSLGIFGIPAFAPTLLNLGMIFAGFVLCPFFNPPVYGMALGVILGGIGQFLCQVPSVIKNGFRFRLDFNFRDPAFLRIIRLMIPMAVGFSATQINVFIVTRIAASLEQGAVAYLNYAFRLMHLPLGIFALAIATVSLPQISRQAALGELEQVSQSYLKAFKLGLFLVTPASILLIFGGEAIISVLFQHGRFAYADTLGAAQALAFYSIGLLAYGAVRITVPVFYAFKQTARPITASILSVVLNIVLCYLLKDRYGFRGLALAASLAGFLNLTVLLVMLKIRLPQIKFSAEIVPIAKILGINLILAGAVWGYSHYLAFNLEQTGLSIRIINLLILLFGAIILYLTLARLAHIRQLMGLKEIFSRIRK